jgi:hypothetical protein
MLGHFFGIITVKFVLIMELISNIVLWYILIEVLLRVIGAPRLNHLMLEVFIPKVMHRV